MDDTESIFIAIFLFAFVIGIIVLLMRSKKPADKWSCTDGSCTTDPKGTYTSLDDCTAGCTVSKKWSCSKNSCSVDPNGTYTSLDDCTAVCKLLDGTYTILSAADNINYLSSNKLDINDHVVYCNNKDDTNQWIITNGADNTYTVQNVYNKNAGSVYSYLNTWGLPANTPQNTSSSAVQNNLYMIDDPTVPNVKWNIIPIAGKPNTYNIMNVNYDSLKFSLKYISSSVSSLGRLLISDDPTDIKCQWIIKRV